MDSQILTFVNSKNRAIGGAKISTDGRHRFELWRQWDNSKPSILWVMHNPSTADENTDDPTIRRIVQFSKDWGFGRLFVVNLSPYRATHPDELNSISDSDLIPADNEAIIRGLISICEKHVLAYGIPCKALQRLSGDIRQQHPGVDWHYLKMTKNGYPSHPLYLKKDLILSRLKSRL